MCPASATYTRGIQIPHGPISYPVPVRPHSNWFRLLPEPRRGPLIILPRAMTAADGEGVSGFDFCLIGCVQLAGQARQFVAR